MGQGFGQGFAAFQTLYLFDFAEVSIVGYQDQEKGYVIRQGKPGSQAVVPLKGPAEKTVVFLIVVENFRRPVPVQFKITEHYSITPINTAARAVISVDESALTQLLLIHFSPR